MEETKHSRRGPWIIADRGNIFYRPECLLSSPRQPLSTPHFPQPLIGPRRSRPHAIHIVSYPSGYIPHDLRPTRIRKPSFRQRRKNKKAQRQSSYPGRRQSLVNSAHTSLPVRPVLSKVLGSFPGSNPSPTAELPEQATTGAGHEDCASTLAPDAPQPQQARGAFDDDEITPLPDSEQSQRIAPPEPKLPIDTSEMLAHSRRPSDPSTYQLDGGITGPAVRSSSKPTVTSIVSELPKPVASGSGVTCSIILAEQNVFLYGFEHENHSSIESRGGTALLRGRLHLNVTKNVKIKAIQLKLIGRARTEWPEGIPPLKQDLFEEEGLRTQVLTFFNAMNDGWEGDYGNQCTYALKNSSANSSSTNLPSKVTSHFVPASSSKNNLTSKELKRLSLQNVQSRSFGKNDTTVTSTTQAKGYKVFYPGTYDYSFELPIDHHQLETTKLQYGSVKWELHATVDRAGAFKPNLHGTKEVPIVRLPDQMSLEMSEPISISRQWEDQLHYDIAISGKSFPIGSKIPIAFKLTPLAKVQIHKLKVYITESSEYWTNDKRVTRKDPGRKILLLEKVAGKPLDPAWQNSDVNTVRGGELSAEERREARETARTRRHMTASSQRSEPEPLPEPSDNLLGDLDLGLESMWGSTEMEANVQIPTCEMMVKNKDLRLHPDCSWKNVNVFHWIKVVLRISRLDPSDPSGTKRRHFEISIDSPFTILDCRATQANTYLPSYSGPVSHPGQYQSACGCPDAQTVATDTSPASSSVALAPTAEPVLTDSLPAPPQAAHVRQPNSQANPTGGPDSPPPSAEDQNDQGSSRPMHLLRTPSFNPPGFHEDSAPPPMLVQQNAEAAEEPAQTPPPNYDTVIGTPSVDGLADYFTRLADYGFEDDQDDSGSDDDETPPRLLERSGRVNVIHPRTPGGRMPSRSLELSRPPVNLDMDSLPKRRNQRAAE